ncbi:ribosome recycling factor [Candidatus Riesia pediculischaeffi]|uniref:Ribosome recycling factor domain-containing protein n=2 Tax=Candidatus Riesia pediculischaeffi TaxID=428411 RepID=A0A1V0HKC6_9ENTR|nr:ribosome recycling factor [Candidatus Riesia pediculischaeffi]ARC53275.1 hypothetical protein AOQ87_01070 [Candidatus Riesia pediculischaeffi]KIE64051.1 Ribosome recycling factor [Candidatus Riesia pediculischaeffi PTSU]
MINSLKVEFEKDMKQIICSFIKQINKVRSERVHPSILEDVSIFCYGSVMPLNRIASISSLNNTTLSVTVFDHSLIRSVREEFLKLKLDCEMFLSGNIIKLIFPAVTEERRRNSIKIIRKIAENEKILIRNIRKDVKNKIKSLNKSKEINEDDSKFIRCEIQHLTDKFIKEIDKILKEKEDKLLLF